MGLPAENDNEMVSSKGLYGQPTLVVTISKGQINTLRHALLTCIAEENYDLAIRECNVFLGHRSEYPKFKPRVERYIRHAIDLIHAIRSKRHFPGIHSLTITKQHELAKKVKHHLDELQYVLRKIERIQAELQVEDNRSTIWVVRAACVAVLVVALAALTIDFFSSNLYWSAYLVADDGVSRLLSWLWTTLGI